MIATGYDDGTNDELKYSPGSKFHAEPHIPIGYIDMINQILISKRDRMKDDEEFGGSMALLPTPEPLTSLGKVLAF